MSDFAKDTNVPTNDCISRQAAIAVADSSGYVGLSVEDVKKVTDEVVKGLKKLPSAQPEPISEEYAKAVRTWLINYQVRCAELQGRYTPYEILGWIVNDWRKENEIW